MARARKSISKYGQLADTVQEAMPLARQAFLDTVPAVSLILDWLAYGPVLDTSKHVASVAPRPVLIIGASDDERTPADQAELLFDAAQPQALAQ